MSSCFSSFHASKLFLLAMAVGITAVLFLSAPATAATALLNGSFEDPMVTEGNMLNAVPTDWRQTWGFATPITIYRPGEADAFYGQIPDGSQAVLYTNSANQEMQPGAEGAEGTGIIMQENVKVRLYFDSVYYTDAETGTGIQISTIDPNGSNPRSTKFYKPNHATDGFGTFVYDYTPTAADAGKNFSIWCYSSSGTSAFLIDNFRYDLLVPLTKPAKPGHVAGGPVVSGGTTPYAWYRADAGLTTFVEDSTKIAWWQDQSGNDRHIESFGEPSITTGGNDGRQVVTFDGIDDQIIGAEADWGTAAPGTVFAVWRRSSDAPSAINYVYDTDLDEERQMLAVNNVAGTLTAGGGEYVADPPTWINHVTSNDDVADPGADEWFVTSVSSTTGETDSVRINGWEVYNGNLLSGGMAGLRLGRFVIDKYYLDGDIAELIVFEGDLSASERKAVENTLMDRWGVDAWNFKPGDTDKNGVVDQNDAATLAANWLASGVGWAGGDFNNDGIVNDIDATLMASNWTGVAANASVPEPSAIVLLLGAAALLLGRRKK